MISTRSSNQKKTALTFYVLQSKLYHYWVGPSPSARNAKPLTFRKGGRRFHPPSSNPRSWRCKAHLEGQRRGGRFGFCQTLRRVMEVLPWNPTRLLCWGLPSFATKIARNFAILVDPFKWRCCQNHQESWRKKHFHWPKTRTTPKSPS